VAHPVHLLLCWATFVQLNDHKLLPMAVDVKLGTTYASLCGEEALQSQALVYFLSHPFSSISLEGKLEVKNKGYTSTKRYFK